MTIILSSSLSRLLRLDRVSRGGYTRSDDDGDDDAPQRGSFINAFGGRRARHSSNNVEAENQLIDQLDEDLG